MSLTSFTNCKYTAFVSFAHADDCAWNKWVSSFSYELETVLPARLMRRIPPIHRSGNGGNGPVQGIVDEKLRNCIRGSFAMFIAIHEGYLRSKWCQAELEFFLGTFGRSGLQERLYVLELSEDVTTRMHRDPNWSRLLSPNQITLPFYAEKQPIEIYADAEKGIYTREFRTRFFRVVSDLLDKIRASTASQVTFNEFRTAAHPSAPQQHVEVVPPSAVDQKTQQPVRIYIESNIKEVNHWRWLSAEVRRMWNALTSERTLVPPLVLRTRGLAVDNIDDYPRLDDADGVILLWGEKTKSSLLAQIGKVERKLPGDNLAPGMVAYLTPPQAATGGPVPAHNWQVVRFRNEGQISRKIQIEEGDSDELRDFLQQVIERKCGPEVPPPLAAVG